MTHRALIAAIIVMAATSVAAAQFFGGFSRVPPRPPTVDSFGHGFVFCRGIYTSGRREAGGSGWTTDYPDAERNFSIRLSELTKTRTIKQPASSDPEYVVVRLTDKELFKCPYLLMEDAGTMALNDREIASFRDYLLKGGFVFVSDTWGEYAREQFDEEIGRVLPPATYPIVNLPLSHPIWRTQFQMDEVPQMPSIQAWRRTGGATDRGVTDPVDPRAIADERGHLMVVMIHNSDIPDGWEREGEDPEYFYRFSPHAYATGINVLLYAMTH